MSSALSVSLVPEDTSLKDLDVAVAIPVGQRVNGSREAAWVVLMHSCSGPELLYRWRDVRMFVAAKRALPSVLAALEAGVGCEKDSRVVFGIPSISRSAWESGVASLTSEEPLAARHHRPLSRRDRRQQ